MWERVGLNTVGFMVSGIVFSVFVFRLQFFIQSQVEYLYAQACTTPTRVTSGVPTSWHRWSPSTLK